MPPSSRKRNKGKERKAKKEENERKRLHGLWISYCNSLDCNHGYEVVIPTDDHPLSSFMDQFFVNFHTINTGQNLSNLFQTHTLVWTNESYRKLAIDILIRIGSNMLWREANENCIDLSWPVCIAQAIVVLEHYDGTNDIDSIFDSRVVRSNWRDLTIHTSSNRRDALKFYRKRTSCKCLKKMHLEARKSSPKTGICYCCSKEKERVLLCVCSRCMIEPYCSRECQLANWTKHKEDCDNCFKAHKQQTKSLGT